MRTTALLLLAACATLGAAPADKPATDKPDGFWRDCGKGLHKGGRHIRGFRLGVEADRTKVKVGEEVGLTLLISNDTGNVLKDVGPNHYSVFLFDGGRYFQHPRPVVTNAPTIRKHLPPGRTPYRLAYTWRTPGTYKIHFALDSLWGPQTEAELRALDRSESPKFRLTDPYAHRPFHEGTPRTHDLVITVTE